MTVRVAAIGDLHFGNEPRDYRPALDDLASKADVFLLAGDLTKSGAAAEARIAAVELGNTGVPTYAVLGNHDHHSDEPDEVRRILERAGINVLEGEADFIDAGGVRAAIVGVKGFCGGFAGACGTDFGEREMKDFILHTKSVAGRLQERLEDVSADVKIVVMHYSPIRGTLHGERLEIYPFLGSYLLAEAVDRGGADLVVHGHAHHGTEKGVTPGGVHVRNVAQPVIQHAYAVYNVAPTELRQPAGLPSGAS